MSKSANVMFYIQAANSRLGLHFPSNEENVPSEARTAFLTSIDSLATANNVDFGTTIESSENPYPNYVYINTAASSTSVGTTVDSNATLHVNFGASAIASWFTSAFTYSYPIQGSITQNNENIEISASEYDSGMFITGLVLTSFAYD